MAWEMMHWEIKRAMQGYMEQKGQDLNTDSAVP